MNKRSYLLTLISCGSLLVSAQSICLSWSLGEDMLNITCRVKDVSHNVSIKDPKGKEQANCHIGGPFPSCLSDWSTKVNSTTKNIELRIENFYSRQIDGKWTCSQNNHIADTMVSLEKGILASTKVTLDAETVLVKNGSMTIKLTCRSCWEPRGHYAEFNINERTEESLSYNAISGSCKNEHGICNPDRCSCSLGREFTLIVEKKKSNFTITCDMSFVDRYKSSRFSVIAVVYYDGEEFIHLDPITVVRKEPEKELTTYRTDGGNKDDGENSSEGDTSKTDVVWKVFGVIGIVSVVLIFSGGIFRAIKYRRNSPKEREKLLDDYATKVLIEDTEKNLEERVVSAKEETQKRSEEQGSLGINDIHELVSAKEETQKSSEEQGSLGINDIHELVSAKEETQKRSEEQDSLGINDIHELVSAKEETQKSSEEQDSLGINDIHELESPKEEIEKRSEEMSRGINNIHKSANGLNEETRKCWEEQEVECSKEVIKELEEQEVECSKEVIKELEGQEVECSKEKIKELEEQVYLKEKKTENILESLCGFCKDMQKHAKFICLDCQKCICSTCKDSHLENKDLRDHNVTDIENIFEIFGFSVFCDKHKELQYDYFCIDHDALCCNQCISSKHIECKKELVINAAKYAKDSTLNVEYGDFLLKFSNRLNKTEKGNVKQNIKDILMDVKERIMTESVAHNVISSHFSEILLFYFLRRANRDCILNGIVHDIEKMEAESSTTKQ